MTVDLVASPRAAEDWEAIPDDAHAAYLRLFQKLRTGTPVPMDKREGALAKEFGVKDLYSTRANVKFRALLSKQGRGWRLEVLASRGDKRYYKNES